MFGVFEFLDDYDQDPWTNFTGIVAESLGTDEQQLNPHSSFEEIGGSSLNIVSAVLKLQESGFPITLEQFLESKNLASLFNSITKSNGTTTTGHKFSITPLTQVNQAEAQ